MVRKFRWSTPGIIALALCGVLSTPLWAQDDASEEDDERRVRRLSDTLSTDEDYSLGLPTDLTPVQPVAETPDVSLPNAEQDARLQDLLVQRAYNPGDSEITAQINAILDDVVSQADAALADGNLVLANQLQQAIATVQPDRPAIARISAEIAQRRQLNQLLTAGQTALQEGRMTEPADDNAVAYFTQALALDESNAAAQAGIAQVQQNLLDEAMSAAQDLDFETANARIDQAAQLNADDEAIAAARAQVMEVRVQRAELLQVSTAQAIDEGRFDEAEAQLNELIALGGNATDVQRLRDSLQDARVYGGFKPGQTFSDNFTTANGQGPMMVVVPAGSYMMGSPDDEADRAANEGPYHRVTFNRGFAMGQTEITVGQFERFVDMTGYRTDAEREGDSTVYNEESGRLSRARATWRNDYVGDRANADDPVMHVSWNDANNYAQWLSDVTGRRYRLPSEAEFEYALRAGSDSRYWWGNGSPNTLVENLTGEDDISRSRRRWNDAFEDYGDEYWGPAPVAQFSANPFGLFDINGNVKEWVLDCWHDTYVRAPTDGSAWINEGCGSRVIRGGDWTSTPPLSRSAFRLTASPDTRGARVGFRVLREL
ncbi:MAG: formylglycine-generating enzyme family protein [Wenzhouxiangellaceae bacterium]